MMFEVFYMNVFSALLYSILWIDKHTFIVVNIVGVLFILVRTASILVQISDIVANVTFLTVYYCWLIYEKREIWSKQSWKVIYMFTAIGFYSGLLIVFEVCVLSDMIYESVFGATIGALFAFAFIRFQLYYNMELIKWE